MTCDGDLDVGAEELEGIIQTDGLDDPAGCQELDAVSPLKVISGISLYIPCL